MRIQTHLILVSAQAVPNLTPVLDESFKPQTVILLVSPDMQRRADDLERVIKKYGVKTQRWDIKDPWDIEYLYTQILKLLEQQNTLDGSLALNATGGTKPMSIAAYRAFQELQQPIFYVHPEQGRVIWLYPPAQQPHKLASRIKLPDFLQAYGATIIQQGSQLGVQASIRELTATLVAQVDDFQHALAQLNYWANQAEKQLSVAMQNFQPDAAFWALVDLFEQADYLSVHGHTLRFPNESARFFVNGGWLEHYVYGVCLTIKKACAIQDIGRGIEVERYHQQRAIRNELDIALLKDNRLYLLECKTQTFARQSAGAPTLYKLDTLKDLLGGLQARAMLISFNELNTYDRQRAGDLNIRLCSYHDLPRLPEMLQTWLT